MQYTLTDKLTFDENPTLKIKDKTITVQADAMTVLALLDILQTGGELKATLEAPKLLFSDKDMKAIKGMKLSFSDYSKVVETAISLALGEDPDEQPGE